MFRTILVLLFALSCGACTMTMQAVNPRPNVVVSAKVTSVAIDASKIADTQQPKVTNLSGVTEPGKLMIHEFRATLENGFRNAMGSHYAAANQTAPLRLVFDMADLEFSNLGRLGRFLVLRFRVRWVDANGQNIAEMAGIARPRNPMETGPRHLEDVVEDMFEKLIDGFDKANKNP